MSINLNYNNSNEYTLFNSLSNELIDMYGVLSKYIVTEKVDLSTNTFGEWVTLKADASDVFEVHLLPDTQENWQGQNIMFDQFGLGNFNTMEFLLSERSLHSIFPNWEESANVNDMISDLILMPSGKVLEVTHVEPLVEGANNLFAYADQKNVVKISTRNYEFRKNDELDIDEVQNPLAPEEKASLDDLDDYFTKLLDTDIIPDENYKPVPGQIKILDYNMNINDDLFIADSLIINGVDSGSTAVQHSSDSTIIESSSSTKQKQDTGSEPITTKTGEFSSPFGDLG